MLLYIPCLLIIFSWSHRTTGRIVWAQATRLDALWVGSTSMVRLWIGFPGCLFSTVCLQGYGVLNPIKRTEYWVDWVDESILPSADISAFGSVLVCLNPISTSPQHHHDSKHFGQQEILIYHNSIPILRSRAPWLDQTLNRSQIGERLPLDRTEPDRQLNISIYDCIEGISRATHGQCNTECLAPALHTTSTGSAQFLIIQGYLQ